MDFVDLVKQQTQPVDPGAKPKRTTPLAQAEESIINGEWEFPKDKEINLIGPDNGSYRLPGHQIKDALEAGYRLEAPNETAKREFIKDYKGLKGDAVVAVGQFADEFLGGIPEAIYDATAQKDDFDRKEALKADHQIANDLAGVGGFATSLLWGGPLKGVAKVGETAGAKAAESMATALAKRGISKDSAKLGAQILANTAETTAQLGVEGLVQAAPMAITETALGDPEAGAETLMMGGGLGAGLGLLAGPTGVIFKKANQAAKDALKKQFDLSEEAAKNAEAAAKREDVSIKVGIEDEAKMAGKAEGKTTGKLFENESIGPETVGDGTILGDAAAECADDSLLGTLKKGLGKIKDNADEIKAASDVLGLPVMEEQLVGDKVVQDYISAKSKKLTVSGIKLARKIQDRFNTYNQVVKNALNIGEDIESHFAVQSEAKAQILQQAKNAIESECVIFNELRQGYQDVALDANPIKQVANNIRKMTIISPEGKALARNIAKELESGNIKNLNDLKNLNTYINGSYSPTAAPEVKKIIGDISEKLVNQEQKTIDRAISAKINELRAPGAGTLDEAMRLQRLYDEMQVANRKWAELAGNLAESGDALGLGNIKRPSDFVRKVEDLTAEQIGKKLLPKSDVASLRLLKQKFPEQFDAIAKLEKARMLDNIVTDDKISTQKFVTQYKKLTPEFREALFDADTRKILDAVKTDFEALPRNVNPSGTAQTISYMELLKPKNFIDPSFYLENAIDLATEQTLKKTINVDVLFNTEKEMGNVNKKLNKIPDILSGMSAVGKAGKKVTENIGSVGSLMAMSRLLDEPSKDRHDAYNKLKDKLEQIVVDPEAIVNNINRDAGGYMDSAPNISNKFIEKNAQTLKYLYDNLPKPMNMSTPFYQRDYKPSDMELSKFERKLSVAMDPFVVLDALKDGTLTKDHMEAALTNYPVLMQAVRGRVLDQMTEDPVQMPYQARIKMSLLMGYDIDGTTKPQNLASYQNAFAMVDQGTQNKLSQSGLNKMKPAEAAMTSVQKGLKT